MIKAVFFDMDGTIGDTMPLCIEAFRKAIEPLAGRSLSDKEITDTFGPSEEATIKALIPDQYDAGFTSFYACYKELHAQCPQPFDGMLDILNDIKSKNIVLAIVTGKGKLSAHISLSQYGIEDLFDAVETGSALGPCKPEGLKSLLKKFGLAPHEAVYVGDAPSDITAANEAGVPIISAAWAITSEKQLLKEMNPDATFESVAAFGAYIKSIV